MNDQALLNGIKQKNEDCYEQLIDKYMRYVAAIIAKIAGKRLNSYDIEEISSDTFIKIWTKADRIELQGDSLKAYLAMTARNLTLNVLRQRGNRIEEELKEHVATADSTEEYVYQKEEQQEIQKLIGQLPEAEQEIIVRRYFYQEKVKDIAQKLGINEKAMSARLGRSKNKMKMLIGQKDGTIRKE
ncbi:RNA polymerase sigma factor [Caldalkalibacillus mannanilyticus]|uniref:RNA polymerase sigma factor n=1 Tax=Caldalkalibacillus mannanilyticus TaxID=1418 RepID=UPI000468EAB8|nr:sigma-70 family RNA polymerase sigma factor [Caldalkalibacillus mannanilyticus]